METAPPYAPTPPGSWPDAGGPPAPPASCPSSSLDVSTAEVSASDSAPWNERRAHTSTATASAFLAPHRRLEVSSPHRPAYYAELRSPRLSCARARADHNARLQPAPDRLPHG